MAEIREIPLELVFGNPDQPRKDFSFEELEDLAASLRENGQLQPIKVTARDGRFMIVMGERRFRALQLNEAPTVLAIVEEEMTDLRVLIEAIVENRQRSDVKPLEEAVAFQACLDAGMTVAELARATGLQQTWRIEERTCLLRLRDQYQQLARSGQLGASQAFEMAQLSPAGQDRLFTMIRKGECPNYAQLRSAAMVLRDAESAPAMFDLGDEPTPAEKQLARGLEKRIGQVAAVLRASTVDNEVLALKKIDPTRAGTVADLLKAMQGDLRRIEAALRAEGQRELRVA